MGRFYIRWVPAKGYVTKNNSNRRPYARHPGAEGYHAAAARELSLEQAKLRAAETELEAARARIRSLQLRLSQAEAY